MELNFKGSFFRDLNNIGNKYLLIAVKEKIEEAKRAKSSAQISRLKQLKTRKRVWYKIEVRTKHNNKIYWILCVVRKNLIEFRRIKPEMYFKRKY